MSLLELISKWLGSESLEREGWYTAFLDLEHQVGASDEFGFTPSAWFGIYLNKALDMISDDSVVSERYLAAGAGVQESVVKIVAAAIFKLDNGGE